MGDTKTLRFVPRKRVALDGKVWWVVYDLATNDWSTICRCKSKTKKNCASWIQVWCNREENRGKYYL